MMILAVEFSTERRSVALLDARSAGCPLPVVSAEENARSVTAVQMTERVLAQAGVERERIQCLAVSLGPGSYAGVRGAITLAQGWQLARGISVLGLSVTDCLAAQMAARGHTGDLAIAIDAQRKEFYLAGYQISGGIAQLLMPLRIVPQAEVEAKVRQGVTVVGPQLERFFPEARSLFPDAGMLVTLAAGRTDFVSAQTLEPIYLRSPDFVKVTAQRSP